MAFVTRVRATYYPIVCRRELIIRVWRFAEVNLWTPLLRVERETASVTGFLKLRKCGPAREIEPNDPFEYHFWILDVKKQKKKKSRIHFVPISRSRFRADIYVYTSFRRLACSRMPPAEITLNLCHLDSPRPVSHSRPRLVGKRCTLDRSFLPIVNFYFCHRRIEHLHVFAPV